jgi:outer membrane protein assembly factor BamB
MSATGFAAAWLASGFAVDAPELPTSPGGDFSNAPVLRWARPLPGTRPSTASPTEPAPPVVDEESIFVGYSGVEALLVLDRRDGSLVASLPTEAPVGTAALRSGDLLLASDLAGYTHAWRRAGREWKPAWEHYSGAPIVATPVLAGDVLYLATVDEAVYALDVQTGGLRWRHQHKADVARSDALELFAAPTPALHGDVAYVGFSDGFLAALGAADGTLRWQVQVGEGTYRDLVAPPAVAADGVIAGGFSEPLLRLDPAKRSATWRGDFGSASAMTLHEGALFHGGADGVLRRIDPRTGEVTWSWDAGVGGTLGEPLVTPLGIVVAAGEGSVYALDPATGTLRWTLDLGEVIVEGVNATPAVSGRDLYAVSNAGVLYALRSMPPRATPRTEDWATPPIRR